jgi:hypothetical protein
VSLRARIPVFLLFPWWSCSVLPHCLSGLLFPLCATPHFFHFLVGLERWPPSSSAFFCFSPCVSVPSRCALLHLLHLEFSIVLIFYFPSSSTVFLVSSCDCACVFFFLSFCCVSTTLYPPISSQPSAPPLSRCECVCRGVGPLFLLLDTFDSLSMSFRPPLVTPSFWGLFPSIRRHFMACFHLYLLGVSLYYSSFRIPLVVRAVSFHSPPSPFLSGRLCSGSIPRV